MSHGPIRNKQPHPTKLLQIGKNREEKQLPRGSADAKSIGCGAHSSRVTQTLKLKLCITQKPAYRCVWHVPSNCRDLEAPRCPLLTECTGEPFCPALKRNKPSGHAKTQRNQGARLEKLHAGALQPYGAWKGHNHGTGKHQWLPRSGGVTWGQGSEGSDHILGADTAAVHTGHHESFQLHNAQHQGLALRKDRPPLTTMGQ